eukprot:8002673-Pyramimonas_sp.AAC.1
MAVTRGVELAAGRLLMNLSSPASEWSGANYPASAEPVTLDSDSEEEPELPLEELIEPEEEPIKFPKARSQEAERGKRVDPTAPPTEVQNDIHKVH